MNKISPATAAAARELAAKRRLDAEGVFTAAPLATAPTDALELAGAVLGELETPEDPGWDAARQAWNLADDHRRALVAARVDAADVATILDYAARQPVARRRPGDRPQRRGDGLA